MAAAAMEREAKKALCSDDFERSVQLYTEVINAGSPNANLYADRAAALVGQGNYHDALVDTDKAIDLDASFAKAYYLKAIALWELEEYKGAKLAIQEGKANAPHYPRFDRFFEQYQKGIIDEAKEALDDGDFELALELSTEAIDDGPATADLYADRSRALIMIGEYDEAVSDTNMAIELDPTFLKPYLLKCVAWYMLKEYSTAKAALEQGSPYGSGDPRLAALLTRCDQRIAEKVKEDALKMESTESAEGSSQPRFRYYFYNTSREVVLIIRANASNVVAKFDKQMLNVYFDVLGEGPCQMHVELSSEIVPQNCKCQAFSRRIEIRLAKDEHLTWKTLSEHRMIGSVDTEFSWKNKRFNGQNIIPSVRDQGLTRTCVFQAMTAATEVELKRQSACLDPPEQCHLKFSTNAFIADYERVEGFIPDDNPKDGRTQRALQIFMEEGVLPRGKGAVKRRIKGFHKMKNLHFEDMKKLIKDGRPVVGSLKLDDTFANLQPGDIYDYDPTRQIKDEDTGAPATHTVVFIGHGVRDGRAYLVFLNSYGEGYCEGGFGRVYYGHAYKFYTIDV